MDEHLFIVTYDIANPKRWRRIYRILEGRGDWLQLSVFQCRLSRKAAAELRIALDETIHHTEDHVLILDLGPAESVTPRVESLGKTFETVARRTIIV